MEYSHFDKQVNRMVNRKTRRKKRVLKVGRPSGAKTLPMVIVSDGKILVHKGVSKTAGMPIDAPISKAGLSTASIALKQAYEMNHLKAFKKIGKGIKKTAKGVGKVAGKVAKGVAKGAKATAKAAVKVTKKITTAAVLAPLLPLKGVMKKALSKKGFKAPSKMEDLVRAFHDNIMKKSSSYETMHPDHFLPIAAIVPPVIEFVKGLITKKKSGQNLTPVEKVIADDSEKVVNNIAAKAEQAGIDTAPTMPGSNAKDSDTGGGITNPNAPEKSFTEPDRKRKGMKMRNDKPGVKDGGISLGNISPVALGAGALALLFFMRK